MKITKTNAYGITMYRAEYKDISIVAPSRQQCISEMMNYKQWKVWEFATTRVFIRGVEIEVNA